MNDQRSPQEIMAERRANEVLNQAMSAYFARPDEDGSEKDGGIAMALMTSMAHVGMGIAFRFLRTHPEAAAHLAEQLGGQEPSGKPDVLFEQYQRFYAEPEEVRSQ